MRKLPIAVAALALMTGAASAQTTNTLNTSPRPAPGAATTAPMHKENAINPLTQEDVSKIEGTSVYGNDDGKIGHVSTALMDPSSKKIDRLVVSAGGVLGVGGHRVAIPVEQFSWDADKGAFKLGTNVLAQRIYIGDGTDNVKIIGVVKDTKRTGMAEPRAWRNVPNACGCPDR